MSVINVQDALIFFFLNIVKTDSLYTKTASNEHQIFITNF